MAFELPVGIKTLNPVLLHEWAGPYVGNNESAALTAANAAIPAGIRLKGLEVTLLIAGVPKKYWYSTGTADSDLKPMITGGSGGSLEIQDEGGVVDSSATILNFTGAGVTASGGSGTATINIPGGTVTTVTNIDLNLSNYGLGGPGIYLVHTGTDYSGGGYEINFQDPASFNNGDIITIINNNPSGLLAALNTTLGYQYYQGTDTPVSSIPWGMIYTFERYSDGTNSRWVCTPPTAKPSYDIYLVVLGSFYSYTIITGGIYTIRTNSDDKTCVIKWPNPVNHAGQEITIINNSDYPGQFISWDSAPNGLAWVPIYNTKSSTNVRKIEGVPMNSTYTFISNGEFWYLKSSYPVINNVIDHTSYDLNTASLTLPEGGGVFVVTGDDAETNILTMPNAELFPGQSITIINNNTSFPIKLFTGNSSQSIYKSYTAQLTAIAASRIVTVTSVLGTWYVLDSSGY